MILKKLSVANLRGIKQADFDFGPGMNLLVGVNGVGKTTVLDCLVILLSQIFCILEIPGVKVSSFSDDDIFLGSEFLGVRLNFEIFGQDVECLVRKDRYLPQEIRFIPSIRTRGEDILSLLAVYYSVNRALIASPVALKASASGTRAMAHASALDSRSFDLQAIAEWLFAREQIASEKRSGHFQRQKKAMEAAVARFITGMKNVTVERVATKCSLSGKGTILLTLHRRDREFLQAIEKIILQIYPELPARYVASSEGGITINVDDHFWRFLKNYWNKAKDRKLGDAIRRLLSWRLSEFAGEQDLEAELEFETRMCVQKGKAKLAVQQLSDGERGILDLVFDLARRLAQGNPKLRDSSRDSSPIILIDELDLHMHPRWQRMIVDRLTKTFPRAQFIASTHSPQIVASVESEHILLMTGNDVIRPERTLGLDSNWILRHIMDAGDRPSGAAKAIKQVEALIKKHAFKKARAEIAAVRKGGLDLTEWGVLEARMARMELLAK